MLDERTTDMPYKTAHGSHYHETYGCHGATIPCSTEGLTPCSDCCGAGGGRGSHTIVMESDVIGVAPMTYNGVQGTLYKLDDLLEPQRRKEISSMDGVTTVVIAPEYAPEIRRTGIFIEDGKGYTLIKAGEMTDIGADALRDSAAAPSVDLADSASDPDARIQSLAGTLSQAEVWHLEDVAEQERSKRTVLDRLDSLLTGSSPVEPKMRRNLRDAMSRLLDRCYVEPNPEVAKGGRPSAATSRLAHAWGHYVAAPEAGATDDWTARNCGVAFWAALREYRIYAKADADGDRIFQEIGDALSTLPDDERKKEEKELKKEVISYGRHTFLDRERDAQPEQTSRLDHMSAGERQREWAREAGEDAKEWLALTQTADEPLDGVPMLRQFTNPVDLEQAYVSWARAQLRKREEDLRHKLGDEGFERHHEEWEASFKSGIERTLAAAYELQAQRTGRKAGKYNIIYW